MKKFTVEITMHDIAHAICGKICKVYESSGRPKVITNLRYCPFTLPAAKKAVTFTGAQIIEGYNCFAGIDCSPEQTKIPSFIKANPETAFEIYKALKGLK